MFVELSSSEILRKKAEYARLIDMGGEVRMIRVSLVHRRYKGDIFLESVVCDIWHGNTPKQY